MFIYSFKLNSNEGSDYNSYFLFVEDNEGAIQGENETKREENMLNFENGQNNNSDFNGFLCIPSVRRLAKEHNVIQNKNLIG